MMWNTIVDVEYLSNQDVVKGEIIVGKKLS